MPDINRTEDRMTKAKAEEVMAHLDALASLAGTPSFSSQMKALLDTAKAQKGNIQAATSMTDKEVNEVVNMLPELMNETLLQTFGAMSSTMQQVLSDPEKLKEALQNKKS